MVLENIIINLKAMTAGFTKSLEKANRQLRHTKERMREIGVSMNMPMRKFQNINRIVEMTTDEFKNFSKGLSTSALKEFNMTLGSTSLFYEKGRKGALSAANAQKRMASEIQTGGGKIGNIVRNLTHGMRGFRMEMLGVMFFGMAMQRTFMGLLNPAMEAMGVFELFKDMLLVVFLPVIDLLFPVFLYLIDLLMNMPEELQLVIGIFVALGVVFGAIISFVGTVVLGIGSMILAWGLIAPVIGIVMAAIGAFIALFAGIALIVTGVVMIVKGKLEGIGLVIMGIGLILFIFIGWWALIPIAVGAAIYWIIKNWEGVKETLKVIFSAIGGWFKEWFYTKPLEWIGAAWDFIKKTFDKIKNLIGGSLFGTAMEIGGALLGSFQTGGIVPQTGPYLLHQGETVVPTGKTNNNSAPIINISANISSDYDVRRLAEELKRYWVSDFESVSQGRTV